MDLFSEFEYGVMAQLLEKAESRIGLTFPNPVTAAAVVHHNKVISWGVHDGPGQDHAEVVAIKEAGALAKGAELLVNLEPCTHQGQTSACTDTIIQSGIKRVVYSVDDPNPNVRVLPAKKVLTQHGIKVDSGLMEKEAFELNEVFFKTITSVLPFVCLKIGLSLDGKIAAQPNTSTTITSETSLRYVHRLRREVDAIIIGVDTVVSDNPLLNVRYGYLSDEYSSPFRVVLDSSGRLPLDCHLLTDDLVNKTIVFVGNDISKERFDQISSKVKVISVTRCEYGLDWMEVLTHLRQLSVYSVLIEGGQKITTSAIHAGVVDKLMLFVSPKLIGEEGVSFFVESQLDAFGDQYSLEDMRLKTLEQDVLVEGYLKKE